MVANIVAAALHMGFRARLRVPDEAKDLKACFVEPNFAPADGDHIQIEPAQSELSGIADGSVLFCAGALDYWRLALRHPRHMRRLRRLFWLQGLESEESYLKRSSELRRFALAACESLAVLTSSITVVPSEAMAGVLRGKYRFLDGASLVVMPNLVSARPPLSAASHSLWDLPGRPALALGYAGSISAWQCFEETCRIVSMVQRHVVDSWLLVLTQQTERALACIRRCGIQHYRLKAASADRVARYIEAFDIGFMLRRHHMVNAVACPVKWLEYWQCGVPVVTTDAIEIVNRAECSRHNCLVNPSDPVGAATKVIEYAERLKQNADAIGSELRDCVSARWTWDAWRDSLEELLSTLS
jgi:hypothetical protein